MEARQAQTTLIDLLRHGETEGGEQYRGQQDRPLSPAGWVQLRRQLPVIYLGSRSSLHRYCAVPVLLRT